MEFSGDLYFSSNALNRLLNARSEKIFRPLGFSSSHAFLLMLVNEKPGIQPTELSQKLKLTPSTITRLIEKLEHQGYVERKSVGRASHVEPTEKGKQIDSKLQQARRQLSKEYSGILGNRYTNVLTEMMNKAAEILKEEK